MDNLGEIVAALAYVAFMLARRWMKKREAPSEPAPAPQARPQPRPAPAPVIAQPRVALAPLPEPWRDLDRNAAVLAAVPDLWSIGSAVHQAGRRFYRSTPGLEPELRARMGLSRAAPLPDSAEGLVARQLALPMGPWLETLFADAWATLALGPAYVVGLRHALVPRDPEHGLTVSADETRSEYTAIPPAHLRVLLACDRLAQSGHRAEASRQLALWFGAVGAAEHFSIPTRDGDSVYVPVDLLRAYGARVQEVIVEEPLASLHGAGLGQLPGLRFGHADQGAAEQAAAALAAGTPARVSGRTALAAALLAADEAPSMARVRAALVATLSPAAPRKRPARRAAPVAAGTRAPGLAGLDVSPAALREAMIARAVLWR